MAILRFVLSSNLQGTKKTLFVKFKPHTSVSNCIFECCKLVVVDTTYTALNLEGITFLWQILYGIKQLGFRNKG